MLAKYSTPKSPYKPSSSSGMSSLSTVRLPSNSTTTPVLSTSKPPSAFNSLAAVSASPPQTTQSTLASAPTATSSYSPAGSLDEAMSDYMDEMKIAEEMIKAHEAQGRTDIKSYLEAAQKYGEPYRQAGVAALTAWLGALGIGGEGAKQYAEQTFTTSPGYEFALQQGLTGVENQYSSTGLRGSGAEQMDLEKYATNMAMTEYKDWENQLKEVAGMGRQSAESAAQREMSAGSTLAKLGEVYAKDLYDLYGTIARTMVESEMFQERQKAMKKYGLAKTAGSVLGIAGDLISGGGFI